MVIRGMRLLPDAAVFYDPVKTANRANRPHGPAGLKSGNNPVAYVNMGPFSENFNAVFFATALLEFHRCVQKTVSTKMNRAVQVGGAA